MRLFALLALLFAATPAMSQDLYDRVEHHYADSNGVKIHYATLGEGPLIVALHGFPDFWYTWREVMESLQDSYRVAALDLRGYNLSDKPRGVENYGMRLLVADVAAVIRDQGQSSAIVAGHDWGGAIAWQTAMHLPQMVDRLIILNLPHPYGLARELATNPEQQKNSAYARRFQQQDAHLSLSADKLAEWVTDPEARKRYIEAFNRSDFEAMLNYYKRNYPREPYQPRTAEGIKVKCPVLMIHGLDDKALLAPALNNSWEWIEKDLTLVTIPGAAHFVQQDAPDLVTRSIKMWLQR